MATDAQKAQDQYELYRYCRVEGGHENYLREHETAKRYYASKQWDPADERERTIEGRLSFTIPEVFRTINAVRGEMDQLSSDVRFEPTNGDPETARILNRLSEHVDRENKMYIHDNRVQLDGLLGGRGFYRQRIKFDDNMQGTIEQFRMRPENVILDHNITSPDPETWDRVFTTEVVSVNDLQNMFGVKASDIGVMPYADWIDIEDRTLAQSLGFNTSFHGDLARDDFKQHRLISQQYKEYKYKDCFVDKATGDISEIPENWPREKVQFALDNFNLGVIRKKVKTLRWRVTCNNLVLHDEDSPYKHFDIVPYFPFFVDGYTLSLFTVIKGPQDLLNYTVSEETLILAATAHAGWKIKHGSLRNMTARELEKKGSKTGVVLELDSVDDAERITPGQPATGFERFGDRARSWINELGSVSPTMLGQGSQYEGGTKAQLNLSRAPVNLHAALTAFQFTKHLLAERKLNLFQTFYTETRTMRIAASPYGQAEEITINQPDAYGRIAHDLTVGKYTARLMPVGSRMAAEEFAFDELVQMKELGINVPNSLFVQTSSINAKSEVMEQLLAANGGEISPEEQRMRELEMEALELENDKTRALAEAARGAGDLAHSRARKVDVDASFDPRTHKAQLDAQRLALEDDRQRRLMQQNADKSERETALRLTEIAAKAAEPPKPAAAPAKKAVKKAAGKTTKKQPR